MNKYKCPHCGGEIGEISVIELTWERVLFSGGLGIGCGLLVYPLMPTFWGSIGAFIIGFLVNFLVWRERLT